MAPPFYVTTPIYYVNARPHIGHAYTTIVADVLARRHRLLGTPETPAQTWFLTGTDEHGQKIERSAAAAGVAPQQFADQVSASFQALWQRMGITNDDFIRTTSPEHARGVQKLFRTLYERGEIYLSSYTGQYCVSEEMFVEGPPGTIGPDGRPTETVTEENFFFRLSRYQLPLLDLIESDRLKITPEARKNEVLSFLRGTLNTASEVILSEAQSAQPKDPEAAGNSGRRPDYSAANSGKFARTAAGTPYQPGALKDLSVSRSSFTWGIPVPEDVQRHAGATQPHVVYVWLDALANYITALGYGSDDESMFHKFWPADVHLVGKEIIRFHCVYWPAFLLAADLPLPKAVTAHGWLLFDDSKMSKSKGNIVRTETILEAFGKLCPPQPVTDPLQPVTASPDPEALLSSRSAAEGSALSGPEVQLRAPTNHERDLFASDVLRYFLLREIPFGQDGSFTFEALVTRYNADLANGYGNLVSRTLTMSSRYLGALVPDNAFPTDVYDVSHPANAFFSFISGPGKLAYANENDKTELRQRFSNGSLENGIRDAFIRGDFTTPTENLAWAVSVVDGYLTGLAPWKLEGGLQRSNILYTAAEAIRIITALLYPILPFATANVWRQLGLGDIEEAARNGELNNLEWGGLKPGTRLGALGPVFPRADKGLAQTMSDLEQKSSEAPKYTPQVTGQNDAARSTQTEFVETPVSSEAGAPAQSKLVEESFAAQPAPAESFDPAAPPRTSALSERDPGTQVAGSRAVITERPGTPTHAEAAPSGIFAAPAATAQPATEQASAQPADGSPEITIDDFARVELRVAKVLVCERIPKADKLLRLEVDLGHERRQILSGIAEWYTPEELLGRRIVVITNLAPRKMRGLLSHGMLLAASSQGGKPALATFADADDLPLGARLK